MPRTKKNPPAKAQNQRQETELGRKIRELRKKIVASGQRLLSTEEIMKELGRG